jgi:choline dehydrogenase-like flavoprotein
MIIDGKLLKQPTKYSADICILGGGVAGIVLANELKDRFSNIIVIESGSESYSQEAQELYSPAKVPTLYPDPSYSRLRFLGGASNHWGNNTSPLSPIDFEKRDWIPNSGWPISYKDIEPYYAKAAKYCGTAEDGYDTKHWLNYFNKKSLTGDSVNLEIGIAKAAMPPVRFFQTHGKPLETSKNITLIKNSNVIDLEFEEKSKEVRNITFNSYSDVNHTVEATQFILCFGGIENARMMSFFNEKYNNKLGNKNDNVGRYFMDHMTVRASHLQTLNRDLFELFEGKLIDSRRILSFFQLSEKALIDNQTTNLRLPLVNASQYDLSDGISSFHILSQKFASGNWPDNFMNHFGNLFTDIDMVIEAIARKEFDDTVFDNANKFGGYRIPMMIEQTPSRDNRIKLGSVKDRYGIPKVEIDWQLTNTDKNLAWKSLELVAREVGAQNIGRMRLLKERESRLFGDQMGFGSHHMGITRMADDEEKGVVDKDLKVFGTENFYIASCSVFPTGGHVPPTMTMVALCVRLAELLKKTS